MSATLTVETLTALFNSQPPNSENLFKEFLKTNPSKELLEVLVINCPLVRVAAAEEIMRRKPKANLLETIIQYCPEVQDKAYEMIIKKDLNNQILIELFKLLPNRRLELIELIFKKEAHSKISQTAILERVILLMDRDNVPLALELLKRGTSIKVLLYLINSCHLVRNLAIEEFFKKDFDEICYSDFSSFVEFCPDHRERAFRKILAVKPKKMYQILAVIRCPELAYEVAETLLNRKEVLKSALNLRLILKYCPNLKERIQSLLNQITV